MDIIKKINLINEHPSIYTNNTKHDKIFTTYTKKFQITTKVYITVDIVLFLLYNVLDFNV